MKEKKTRGKQKIDIKRVEKNEDRMVTFSKRRSGIYTKLSEISVLCGADVGFLIYSGAGKPYTFGSPSFDAVAHRFLERFHHRKVMNGEGSSSLSSSSMIVDAYKKVRMDELCKSFNNLMEQTNAEEEKRKKAESACAQSLPVRSDAWWKVDPKDEEEAKVLLKRFETFYEDLCDVATAKCRGRCDASTSSSLPHQANFPRDTFNRHG